MENQEQVKDMVRRKYSEIALQDKETNESSCCGSGPRRARELRRPPSRSEEGAAGGARRQLRAGRRRGPRPHLDHDLVPLALAADRVQPGQVRHSVGVLTENPRPKGSGPVLVKG